MWGVNGDEQEGRDREKPGFLPVASGRKSPAGRRGRIHYRTFFYGCGQCRDFFYLFTVKKDHYSAVVEVGIDTLIEWFIWRFESIYGW